MNEKPQKIYIGHNYIWHTSPYGDSNFEYLPADYLKELRKIWDDEIIITFKGDDEEKV